MFSDEVTSEIKQSLLNQVAGYRRIFPGSPGQARLIDQMDTLKTGVGTASKTSSDPWLIERVNAMHNDPPLTREDFEAYTFDDMAGVYLLRPQLSELIATRNAKSFGSAGKAVRERKTTVEAKVHRINSQWTGIQREHVARCAEQARASGKTAGVILAAGADDINPKRQRGSQLVTSLALRVSRGCAIFSRGQYIVLAIGQAKSETVIEAVNQSLVNHLLIDQDLADALVEDLRS